jgi:hypothetical protein
MNINFLDWQTVIALLIVLIALAVFARKTWKSVFVSSTTGCGTSCSSCPAAAGSSKSAIRLTKLIQLKDNAPPE